MKHGTTVSHSVGLVLAAAGLLSSVACDGGRISPVEGVEAKPSKPREGATPPRETREKAKVTPAIIAASEKLLTEHADAPLGSEFPITVEGRNYVGRIEEHDNPEGEPGRPRGKHKGVTVYER